MMEFVKTMLRGVGLTDDDQPVLPGIDQPFLVETGPPVSTGTQIICGDCSGDLAWPFVTEQTEDGRCNVCGGRSYVLAQRFGAVVFRRIGLLAQVEIKEIVRAALGCGLIREDPASGQRDMTSYWAWLKTEYGVSTSLELAADQRILAINRLRLMGMEYGAYRRYAR
jgi:hypothetical protein